MKLRVLTLALVLVGACRGEAPAPFRQQAPPPDRRMLNRADIGNGGSIVSRTAEHTLQYSAAMLIDGEDETMWSSPQRNPEQTIVLSLPARTSIEEIALRVLHADWVAPHRVTFEASLDGKNFTPLATLEPKPILPQQTFRITPGEARYVRMTTAGKGPYSQIKVLELHGPELEPPRLAPIEGCWSINGFDARFFTHGSRVLGIVGGGGKYARFLDGGSDSRTYRFAWTRGPENGVSIVTLSPDGQHLSGIVWHTEYAPLHIGDSWFGERAPCNEALKIGGTEVFLAFLRREHVLPLYGLRFDDQDRVDEQASNELLSLIAYVVAGSKERRFELIAHEFRGDEASNKARARKRIDAVRVALQRRGADMNRVAFLPAGSDQPRVKPANAVMHALYNAVSLRLAR